MDAPLNKLISASQHAAIPSIEKPTPLVEEQRKRFPDIENYPCALSERLEQLRDDMTAQMCADNSGWKEILKITEQASEEVGHQK